MNGEQNQNLHDQHNGLHPPNALNQQNPPNAPNQQGQQGQQDPLDAPHLPDQEENVDILLNGFHTFEQMHGYLMQEVQLPPEQINYQRLALIMTLWLELRYERFMRNQQIDENPAPQEPPPPDM